MKSRVTSIPLRRCGAAVPATVLAVALLFSANARADQVRVNGIWIPGVEIVSVADSQVTYVTAGGQRTARPFAQVSGFKVDDRPQYAEAMAFIATGRDEPAVRLLQAVRRDPGRGNDWLADEASRQLSAVYDRLGKGAEAAEVYLSMVERGAEDVFLDLPPTASVAQLPEADRQRLQPRIERALTRVGALAQQPMQQLLRAASPDAAVPRGPATSDASPSADGSPYPEDAAVLLPIAIERNPVADFVAAGDFEAAIAAASAAIRQQPSAQGFFLRARSRQALAERSSNASLLKDAGLDYARVLAYYPRTPLAAPALVELGEIHDRLGAADTAARLFAEAGTTLDAEDHPRYTRRLQQLTADR